MSATIPYGEPARLHAGDTAKWLKALPDYPAGDGWVLSYVLANSTQRLTVSAAASGDEHLVTVAAATTAAWLPGDYAWRATVALSGEVFTVGAGQLTVAASLASPTDARTSARRMLDAVQAVLEGRATDGVDELTIGGRSVRYMRVPDLLALRDRLRVDVAREEAVQRAQAGLPSRGRVLVRFGA